MGVRKESLFLRPYYIKFLVVFFSLSAIISVISSSESYSYALGVNSGNTVNIIQNPTQWVFNNDSGFPSIDSPIVNTTTTTIAPVSQMALENGGEVTVGVQQLPRSLNPYTPQGQNSVAEMIDSAIWPGVFAVGSGDQMVLQQSLIQSAEVVGINPQRVEYQITPGAKWASGQPITANDFIAMWHFILQNSASLPPNLLVSGYSDISTMVSLNSGTEVLLTFTHPYADWNGLFSTIIPPWLLTKAGLPKLSNYSDFVNLPSGGPFVIKNYIPGKSLLLAQNANYFGTKANLEYIKFLVVSNESQMIRDLANGTVDISSSAPNSQLSSFLNANPSVVATQVTTSRLWQIVFNVAVSPLSNLNLRNAIASIIDRTEIFWDTEGIISSDFSMNNNQLFLRGYPQSAGNSAGFQQSNLPNAAQYLIAAKYHMNQNGNYISKKGTPLKLTLLVPLKAKLADAMAGVISAELRYSGIRVSLKYETLHTMLDNSLPEGKFQFALAPYDLSQFPVANAALYVNPDYSEATLKSDLHVTKSNPNKHQKITGHESHNIKINHSNFTNTINKIDYGLSSLTLHSQSDPFSLADDAVNSNISGFQSSAVSSLLQQANQQLNTPISISDYNQADALIWQAMPTLPLFQLPADLIVRVGVENVTYGSGPATFGWDMADWGIQLNSPIPVLH
ncbi:MAG: ABC transporter substrate-binding protein [Firmicutes bacterium]|nr:ABC transporter substrate-binding protein [Bacillota bacterium]